MNKLDKIEPVHDCSNCKHATFCPLWGNYECSKSNIRVNIYERGWCQDFKLGKTSPFAKKCHCEDCTALGVPNYFD